MREILWNLQLLADAGTLVNYIGSIPGNATYASGYVNAGTGVNSVNYNLDPELKTFYDTEMLENARVDMVYAQFAKKQNLPKGRGKTVEWRKWNTFAKASQLTEGVIPTGQTFGVSTVTGSISQYGTYASLTDQLELHAYDDIILGATEEMGASLAETQEYLIRQALLTGSNILYADVLDVNGAYVSTPTGAASMYNDSTNGFSYLTPDVIAQAVNKMKKNKAPTINGKYYAVVHPDVAYDLRKSDEWIEAHKYASPEEIFNGEIGELHGVRFLESNFAPITAGTASGTHSGSYSSGTNNGAIYDVFMFGKDAFGIIDPEGGAAEMIIHDKREIGGPLNQFSTIGYKLETNGATILYATRLLDIRCTSSFSATATAN